MLSGAAGLAAAAFVLLAVLPCSPPAVARRSPRGPPEGWASSTCTSLLALLSTPALAAAEAPSSSRSQALDRSFNNWADEAVQIPRPAPRFAHVSSPSVLEPQTFPSSPSPNQSAIATQLGMFVMGGVLGTTLLTGELQLSAELWLYQTTTPTTTLHAANSFWISLAPAPTALAGAAIFSLSPIVCPTPATASSSTPTLPLPSTCSGDIISFGGVVPFPSSSAPSTPSFDEPGLLAITNTTALLLRYTLSNNSWQELPLLGSPPPPRAFMAAAAFDAFLCVWGGLRPSQAINGQPQLQIVPNDVVFCLTRPTLRWSAHQPAGPRPSTLSLVRAGSFSIRVPLHLPAPAALSPPSPSAEPLPGYAIWLQGGGLGPGPESAILNDTLLLVVNTSNPSAPFTWASQPVVHGQPPVTTNAAACWAADATSTAPASGIGLVFGGSPSPGFVPLTTPQAGSDNVYTLTVQETEQEGAAHQHQHELVWTQAASAFEVRPEAVVLGTLVCHHGQNILFGGSETFTTRTLTSSWGLQATPASVLWTRISDGLEPPELFFPLLDLVGEADVVVVCGQERRYSPTCKVYRFSLNTDEWALLSPPGPAPPARYGAVGGTIGASAPGGTAPSTATNVLNAGGGFVLHGGLAYDADGHLRLYNGVHFLNLTSGVWESWIADGQQPAIPALAFSSYAIANAREFGRNPSSPSLPNPPARPPVSIYVFGGCPVSIEDVTASTNFSRAFWALDLDASRAVPAAYRPIAPPSSAAAWPPGRCGAGGAVLRKHTASAAPAPELSDLKFYVFGGYGATGVLSDLWMYDLDLHRWIMLGDELTHHTSEAWPSARAVFGYATFSPADEKFAVSLGGDPFGNFPGSGPGTAAAVLDDSWIFDQQLERWTQIQQQQVDEDAAKSEGIVSMAYRRVTGDDLNQLVRFVGVDFRAQGPINSRAIQLLNYKCGSNLFSPDVAGTPCLPCENGDIDTNLTSGNSVCMLSSSGGTTTPPWVAAAVVLPLLLILALIGKFVILPYLRARRMLKTHHIFISYRVATDADLARRLVRLLEGSTCTLPLRRGRFVPVTCYLDAKSLQYGEKWKDGFLTGLKRSCLFVPILSEAGLQPIKDFDDSVTKEDNVLLEYETALQLRAANRIQILPLLVGRRSAAGGCLAEYDFAEHGPHTFPNLASLSAKTGNIRHTITDMFGFQGIKMGRWVEDSGRLKDGLADVVLDVLLNSAWGNCETAGRDCLQLWRFWEGAVEERWDQDEPSVGGADVDIDVDLEDAPVSEAWPAAAAADDYVGVVKGKDRSARDGITPTAGRATRRSMRKQVVRRDSRTDLADNIISGAGSRLELDLNVPLLAEEEV